MPLNAGTSLGPYSVTAKLDRDVALKVLPEAFRERSAGA